MSALATKKFEYGLAKISDFSVDASAATIRKGGGSAPRVTTRSISVDGRTCKPSRRFFRSLQTRFGFSSNIFRYFRHDEVFDRISQKSPNDVVRYCIEHDNVTELDTILAVSNPGSAAIKSETLMDLLSQHGSEDISYSDGIVHSTHKPRVSTGPFDIQGDSFANQFVIDTPIDGFGRPNIYLSLLRLICSNGAIGYSKAFRSEISTGKKDEDVAFALIRAIDGFNNEDGFAAMRQRFDSAARSWASVNEVQKLYKTLTGIGSAGELKKTGREVVQISGGQSETVETHRPTFDIFHKMSGDITQLYGLANLDSLSTKRQRTLPAACKVYDLLNFATEVATHKVTGRGGLKLQSFVGDLIAGEYDLEGTVDQFSDWRDFFLQDANTAETMRVMQAK